MKTILIPVDFSDPSNNAVDYAADRSNDLEITQITIFTNYYVSLFEQIYPSADFIQSGDEVIIEQKAELTQKLHALKARLLKRSRPGVKVKTALLEIPLLRGLLKMIDEEKPDAVLLGSNNHDGEESSIGNNMIEIAKICPVPVLVIPPKTQYRHVKNAVVACDFRTLNHVSLLQRLHKIKHWHHPKLALLNVDPAQKHLRPDHPALEIKGIINEVLKDYEYRLYYSDDTDILKGVLTFADKNDQQMIIALPGVHSFLYSLTHRSITEGLSRDANKPVLILK